MKPLTKQFLPCLIVIFAFFSGPLTAHSETVIKAISYNTHIKMSVDVLTDMIQASDAGIVGIQETVANSSTNNDAYAEVLGWNVFYPGKDTPELIAPPGRDPFWWIGGHHMSVALLTKYEVIEHQYYNITDTPDDWIDCCIIETYRSSMRARLRVAPDEYVNVFVLHSNPWNVTWHPREIEGVLGELNDYYPDDPTIILGDFNTRSHLDGFLEIESTKMLEAAGFVDTYRQVHPNVDTDPGITCENMRIDYVYVRNATKIVDAFVVEEGIFGSNGFNDSDHLAVFAQIQIHGGGQ
ncbi:MAG: endonuclease/exonuclease/phosphatase family protein [Desulfobacteraceae bacterium]|nr:endonuclease/exonuclease/phosphatase family protein [Desulfobacteraceae bacterium]